MSWPPRPAAKAASTVMAAKSATVIRAAALRAAAIKVAAATLPKTASAPPKPAARAANTATTDADGLIGVTLRVSSA
jgi:hypothetical protein